MNSGFGVVNNLSPAKIDPAPAIKQSACVSIESEVRPAERRTIDSGKAILTGTSFDDSAEDVRARTEGRDDGQHGAIKLDGFGFDNDTRDQVQWMLEQGRTMEEIRVELDEEE